MNASDISTNACSLQINGAPEEEAISADGITEAFADFKPSFGTVGMGTLDIGCETKTRAMNPGGGYDGQASFSLSSIGMLEGTPRTWWRESQLNGPGTYSAIGHLELSRRGDGLARYDSSIDDGHRYSLCTVTLDRFAPETRSGMAATFSCNALVRDAQSTAVSGRIRLGARPYATNVPPSDLPPTCSIATKGALGEARADGNGNSLGCTASFADGTIYSLRDEDRSRSSGGNFISIQNAWGLRCGVSFSDYEPFCKRSVEIDEGYDGHYVADESCTLPAWGGQTIDLAVHIDGIHDDFCRRTGCK
jgi:hypothetical protein